MGWWNWRRPVAPSQASKLLAVELRDMTASTETNYLRLLEEDLQQLLRPSGLVVISVKEIQLAEPVVKEIDIGPNQIQSGVGREAHKRLPSGEGKGRVRKAPKGAGASRHRPSK